MPPPSFVCARTRQWGLVGGSAVHVAMQRVQLAAQLLAVLSELVQQRYERREGLPLDRAADLLVQHLAQHFDSFSRSSTRAFPRCEMAFFSSGRASASVRLKSNTSAKKSGS